MTALSVPNWDNFTSSINCLICKRIILPALQLFDIQEGWQ